MPKARVLAVDDQRYFRELIAGMLTEEGFEATTASTGEEALRLLDKADFDIVLTDLVMPGMDGSELVHRVKERDPNQDIVVVTGVVDVKTAVDAMKLGATDYVLKPFDRHTLAVTLEGILQTRRLKAEHDRLLAENIEYIGERTLYERALGLFSSLSLEPLAARIIEGLCLETRAQGGVIWVAGENGPDSLDLAAARGLVRMNEEAETLDAGEVPAALRDGSLRSVLARWGQGDDASGVALFCALHRDGRVIGFARLTDKLEGDTFDELDRACAEKFLHFAGQALHNALRVRALERRRLEDPITGAYHLEYFQDVMRIEIEKANRFGRTFALLHVDPGPVDAQREGAAEAERCAWLAGVADELRRVLRATDLLAVDTDNRFYILLAEADALGAAVLKRRILRILEASDLFGGVREAERFRPRASTAIYPGDGTQSETLLRALARRVEHERRSPVIKLGLEHLSAAECLQALLERGTREKPEMSDQIARFLLSDVARTPRDRTLLYVSPGKILAEAVQDGLDALRDARGRSEVVIVSDGARPAVPPATVSWVSSERLPGLPPLLIQYGDAPPYALVTDEANGGGTVRVFHTGDRTLVEHLVFHLQRELQVPAALWPGGADPEARA